MAWDNILYRIHMYDRNRDTMKRPEPITEILIEQETSALKQWLKVYLASDRAVEWMNQEALRFECADYKTGYRMGENSINVNPCYDINEVIAYLKSPMYEENSIPRSTWDKIVKRKTNESDKDR